MESANVSDGVTGHQNVDEHQIASDWRIAKSVADPETGRAYTEQERKDASARTVEKHWQSAQYQQLESGIGGDDVVFVTMPSTSGMNMLTPRFAWSVQNYFRDRGKDYHVVFGEELVEGLKNLPIKKMKAKKRIFEYRPYEFLNNPANRDTLDKIRNKPVVILEDAILSGASIKGFYDSLAENGVTVKGIACLIGEPEIQCTEEQREKLERVTTSKEITLAAPPDVLLKRMSRWQADKLIDRLDKVNAGDKNAINEINDRILRFIQQTKLGEFARDIQGIQHGGTLGVLGQGE